METLTPSKRTAAAPQPEEDSSHVIVNKRKFDRQAEGIDISAQAFSSEAVDPQAKQDALLARLEENLGIATPPEERAEQDALIDRLEQNLGLTSTEGTPVEQASPATPEAETSPEKKKKIWFKRLGYAASMNFKIIRGIGAKNYAGEIKDNVQTVVSEKIDATKAKVYQKTEDTLWKLADKVNTTTEKATGTYARTKAELGAEYTAFKQGFTADLDNAIGMWLTYREQARIDKEARKKYVSDRIMEYALKRERQLAAAHGASL